MQKQDAGTCCWKIEAWPGADRQAWILGCTPGDPFDDPRPGAALSPATLKSVAKGYGRWLGFLASAGYLDPDVGPLQRVTRARLGDYGRQLRAAGNADITIISRFSQLAMALHIMFPNSDVGWIRKPGGRTLYSLLPNRRRLMRAPGADVLFAWSLEMMDQARARGMRQLDLIRYRDGLLLAILAARGRRLRSMALLRVGYELIRREDSYRIELAPHQVKTKKWDRFALPSELTPYMTHYLNIVRPALLAKCHETALWLQAGGKPLAEKGIQAMVMVRTRERFGEAYGPHRFRHAAVTTAVLQAPQHPGLASAMLGISAEVAAQHYCLAGQAAAAMKFAAVIKAKRRAARGQSRAREREFRLKM